MSDAKIRMSFVKTWKSFGVTRETLNGLSYLTIKRDRERERDVKAEVKRFR